MDITVKFKKLDDRAVVPQYAHDGDVCMDMTAISVEYDEERDMYVYHTGLAFESDYNIGMFMFPRSSNRKTDAYLCNHVGIADSAIYKGEILWCFKLRDGINTLIANEMIAALTKGISLQDIVSYATEKVLTKARNLEYAPYKVGDRIGQMVFLQYPTVRLEETDELKESVRGDGGFGSTGN